MWFFAIVSLLAPPAPASPEAAACVMAAVRAPLLPVSERFAVVSQACAGLFLDATCRRAWDTAASQPTYGRAAYIIDGCRAAYCPVLTPRPSLCAGELTPSRMLAEAAPLVQAALAHDHGPDFAAWMAALIPPPPAAAPPGDQSHRSTGARGH